MQVRVQAFEARDRWPPEAVDRLRIGLPGYIPRKPLPWPLRVVLLLRYIYNWRRYRESLASLESSRVADIRHRALYAIAHRTETDLAGISAKLDDLAPGVVGGLHFRLDRSAHSVRELRTLLRSLRINAIPTWVSYDALAERGLAPAFDQMRRVGRRLQATCTRLRAIAESVEAGALRGQSAATRHNRTLVWRSAAYATLLLLLLVLAARSTPGRALIGRIGEILRRLIAAVHAHLPAWATGAIEQAIARLQSWLP